MLGTFFSSPSDRDEESLMASMIVCTQDVEIPPGSDYAAMFKQSKIMQAPGSLPSFVRVYPKKRLQRFRLYIATTVECMQTRDVVQHLCGSIRCKIPESWDIKFLFSWCIANASNSDGVALVNSLVGDQAKTVYLTSNSNRRTINYIERDKVWGEGVSFIGYEEYM